MHRCDLQCFVASQVRQKAWDPPRQQAFAGTRRTHEEDVVVAGRGNDEGSLGCFLPAHIGKIGIGVPFGGNGFTGERREVTVSVQMKEEFLQRSYGKYGQALDVCGLRSAGSWDVSFAQPAHLGALEQRENAGDTAHRAIKAEFSQEQWAGHLFRREMFDGAKDG
jgi:hypothetical protein